MRVLLHQCLPWNVNPVIHSLRIWSNGPNGPTQRRRIRWLLNHCGRCHRRFCRGNQRSTLLGDSANGFDRPRLSPFAACLQTWWLRDAPGMFRERFGWFLWSKVDLTRFFLLRSARLSAINSNWSSLHSLFSFSCVDSGLHPDCSGTSQKHSVFLSLPKCIKTFLCSVQKKTIEGKATAALCWPKFESTIKGDHWRGASQWCIRELISQSQSPNALPSTALVSSLPGFWCWDWWNFGSTFCLDALYNIIHIIQPARMREFGWCLGARLQHISMVFQISSNQATNHYCNQTVESDPKRQTTECVFQ